RLVEEVEAVVRVVHNPKVPVAAEAHDRLARNPFEALAAPLKAYLVPFKARALLEVVAGARHEREDEAAPVAKGEPDERAGEASAGALVDALAVNQKLVVLDLQVNVFEREVARRLLAHRRVRVRERDLYHVNYLRARARV